MKIKRTLLLFIVALCAVMANGQKVALKTNLLYDATLTPNLGAEFGLSRRSTIQLVYGFNPWKLSDGKSWRHWQLMPEYRWWLCSKFNGHFFGVHAMGGQYNMANIDVNLPFTGWPGDLDKYRYQGWNAGGGLTYGYQWILGRHWNAEAAVGVGYNYIKYEKYPCANCGTKLEEGHRNYFGPTKAVLSLIYAF